MAAALNELDETRVDVSTIEKQLAEQWRGAMKEGALTKAALWNVVAHTWTSQQHAHAAEILSRASASVPQRTIVVRADPEGRGEISSYISANCHLVAGGKQLCSEEVSIVASGDRVDHVPPLVSALLLPDMPVAVWWMGDLPRDLHYAEVLLDPADRLIFDSSHLDGPEDLDFVARIADQTTTAPADLNWARIEEWRVATAALFDPAPMRERLQAIRLIRVFSGGGKTFGELSEALLYVAWMTAQTGVELEFEFVSRGEEAGIVAVEILFEGDSAPLNCVPRALMRKEEDLIVRLLKRPEADRVYLKSLRIARRLAK